MAKKLEVIGNYLVLTDTVDSTTIEFPVGRVRYKDTPSVIQFSYIDDSSQDVEFSISDLLQYDGSPFASTDDLITYLRSNTGFNTLTGGSVGTGWAQYGDSQYTVGSPLVISQGTTETIDIDGLGSTVKSQLPNGVTDLYDVATSKITPVKSGDGYSFSLGFQAASTSNNGDATISVNIGGAFGQIFKRVFRMPRGTGIYHDMYFTTQYYTLDTFLANGGTIEIESGNGTTSIHSITLQIHRTYAAK